MLSASPTNIHLVSTHHRGFQHYSIFQLCSAGLPLAPVWSVNMAEYSNTAQLAKPSPPTLASSLPPVPAKLVKCIRELLPEILHLASTWRHCHPTAPEKGKLTTIHGYFTTYVAEISEAHPKRIPDMLMYMRLLSLRVHLAGSKFAITPAKKRRILKIPVRAYSA